MAAFEMILQLTPTPYADKPFHYILEALDLIEGTKLNEKHSIRVRIQADLIVTKSSKQPMTREAHKRTDQHSLSIAHKYNISGPSPRLS